MILVVGGTGRLGGHLVRSLTTAGETVRVLTRDPAASASYSEELLVGDLRDPTSLARAVAGCSTVISAAHGFLGGRGAGPEVVDRDGNRDLIAAAATAGVDRFVMVSVHGASAAHPMVLHRMKYAAEQALRSSSLDFTILRPSAYYETWIEVLGAKLSTGGPVMVFGKGANPLSFVSVRDVCDVVMLVVQEHACRAEAVDVGGPEDLTMGQFARALVEHAGGEAKVKHVPGSVLRTMSVLARPVNPAFARMARGAVAMDTVDMTMDPAPVARRFPSVHWHTLADVLITAPA